MGIVLVTAITALTLAVFFSGMQIVFASASKLRIETDDEQVAPHSGVHALFLRNPRQYRITLIVGYYFALVAYGIAVILMPPPVACFTWAVLIRIAIAGLVLLLTILFVPPFFFHANPNSLLQTFAFPLHCFYYLFYPLSLGIAALTENLSTGFFPVASEPEGQILPETGAYASETEEESEVKLFRNALDFSKVRLREIMVPRTEIEALDIHAELEELKKKYIATGYSRILFYDGNIDNILGYVHQSAIFSGTGSIRSSLKSVLIVPETMSANKLLSQLIQQHRSIAVVVDEFGGTSGMVTTEDILEEIFGEIEDEHDTTDLITRQISKDEYVLSARIDLDILNEKYKLDFPVDENYETLAGYILAHHESIPGINTVITIGRYRFKVIKATNTRIVLVNLKVLPDKKQKGLAV